MLIPISVNCLADCIDFDAKRYLKTDTQPINVKNFAYFLIFSVLFTWKHNPVHSVARCQMPDTGSDSAVNVPIALGTRINRQTAPKDFDNVDNIQKPAILAAATCLVSIHQALKMFNSWLS